MHILYVDSVRDRLPEIKGLADYWQWLGEEAYPGVPRILTGDFNLDSEHFVFDTLELLGVEAAYEDGRGTEVQRYRGTEVQRYRGTTISTTEGRYPNHYDYIFL